MFISIDVHWELITLMLTGLLKDSLTPYIDSSTTWMSNTIDWEYSSNLSLMSISSYVEYETGNIYPCYFSMKYLETGDINNACN